MLKIMVLFVFLITNSVFQPISSHQCFDRVSFIVYRDTQKVVAQLADTVTDEKRATEIRAERQYIPVLQMGCFKSLPKLKYLVISECRMEDIEKDALIDLPKLRTLSVTLNNIRVIKNQVFASLSLVKLSLIENKIEKIEKHAFYNMPYLEILDLSLNRLYSLKPDIFYDVHNLRQINLSNNKLKFVYDYFFWDCFTFSDSYNSFIDLSGNNISEIDRNTFVGVYFIDSLLLNNNQIKNIHPNAFYGLRRGKTLDLRDNALDKVPPNILYDRKFKEVLYDESLEDQYSVMEQSFTIKRLRQPVELEDSANLSVSTENSTVEQPNQTYILK